MLSLFKRKVYFAQTLAGLETQVDAFLTKYGFPVDQEYRRLVAQFIQHMPESQDNFEPNVLARYIRKAVANMHAFYIIQPDRRPKAEVNDQQGPAEASKEVGA